MEEIYIKNVVIGSGAAGFAAALRLVQNGESDTAVLTENICAGTSRNTGSDKQTYYKLSLASEDRDSVRAMAEDLFAGQCVDGDQALCEAALSVRGFMYLVELGVPFPCTEYGEYMGYKTDHDRGRRATSAGPYTSRLMTQALERRVKEQNIVVYDKTQAIRLLVSDGRVHGVLCLDEACREHVSYKIFWAQNVILATGGPAGIYRDSVYPQSQLGTSGMAFEAGVRGKNLTEWQFGLASVKPRWNVSGTYMQALPAFISTAADGTDEREFLREDFNDVGKLLSLIFLKGYQWPFDVNKCFGGSSLIDLLVYRETVLRGRRVWLDYRVNSGGAIDFSKLSPEAYNYLQKAGALLSTPIERLARMNAPAIAFYAEHGVDLYKERLEIAVCAQHNNGGLATDAGWQTRIQGLYAVGEVNGSHGVLRPGGTALNAGQAGALRAADSIRLSSQESPASAAVREKLRRQAEAFADLPAQASGTHTTAEIWKQAQERMSACGGMIRSPEALAQALADTDALLANYTRVLAPPQPAQTAVFYRLRDLLLAQKVYLFAMLNYAGCGGGSRGSALYTDPSGEKPRADLSELYRCTLDNGRHGQTVQEVWLENAECRAEWRPVRPIPEVDYFFENQWRAYRQRYGL